MTSLKWVEFDVNFKGPMGMALRRIRITGGCFIAHCHALIYTLFSNGFVIVFNMASLLIVCWSRGLLCFLPDNSSSSVQLQTKKTIPQLTLS
jgi:hypothetical protein